ncbi:MAG: M48 family metallopeptidase [Candidatus Sericytochromatia bacterium]|nr:M48 family metallopeptidase [Candidatus Tanganyikabacteria bacterium]
MEIELIYVSGRTARADLKGGVLQVRMPRHWPRSEKESAISRFQRWASRRQATLSRLPPPITRAPMSEGDLWDLVRQINAETVQVDVVGVRIGRARFTRLAQANWQTRTLTFSRVAVQSLPDQALRYLIVHELAHLRIPNHSQAFWDLVARFVPDWKYWRHVAQAHFVRAAEAGPQVQPPSCPLQPLPPPRNVAQRADFAPSPDTSDDDDPARPAYEEPASAATAGNLAARALFDDLTGPHGTQLALFSDLAPDYPV